MQTEPLSYTIIHFLIYSHIQYISSMFNTKNLTNDNKKPKITRHKIMKKNTLSFFKLPLGFEINCILEHSNKKNPTGLWAVSIENQLTSFPERGNLL